MTDAERLDELERRLRKIGFPLQMIEAADAINDLREEVKARDLVIASARIGERNMRIALHDLIVAADRAKGLLQ